MRLPLLLLLVLLGGCDMKPNRAVQRPPEEYRAGPAVHTTTVKHFDDIKALQDFCRYFGGGLEVAQRAGDHYAMACHVPNIGGSGQGVIALPTRKAWPSQSEINDLEEHEWGHARGWGADHAQPAPKPKTFGF